MPVSRHAELDTRDAVMAATALNRGLDTVLSTDPAFDLVDGLRRVDPLDAPGVAALS